MASRYWVGGTASWDGNAGSKWSTASGGAGGASVPTSADDVFFDANSAGTCTISSGNTGAKSINCTGFTGTLAGSAAITVSGSVTFVTGMTITYTGTLTLSGTGALTSGGKTLGPLNINGSGITVTLGGALNIGANTLTVTQGVFDTNNYSVTAAALSSSNSNTRTINLGASSVQLTGSSPLGVANKTNLTFNAGTSSISFSGALVYLSTGASAPAGLTFYDVSFTSTALGEIYIYNPNTFNSLTFFGLTSAGIKNVQVYSSQTIFGNLSILPGSGSNSRPFFRSDSIGQARTFTCGSISALQDIDFRDIVLAGAAVSGGPVSGTRLGDCGGNSGFVFDAPKAVYYVNTSAGDWSSGWSLTPGGISSGSAFPLAQDTAVFQNGYPNFASVTMTHAYNIGTIDMSSRTAGSMTLSFGSVPNNFYGDWINGVGGISITATPIFSGRATQTITSAGKAFSGTITANSVGGSIVLADNLSVFAALYVYGVNCTFNANNKNVNIAFGSFVANAPTPGSINVGSGTWSIGDGWSMSSAFAIHGDGTIRMTSAGTKNFNGGGLSYSNIVLEQAGAGQLTILGNNTFKTIASSVSVANTISLSGYTQTITGQWTAKGSPGNLLTISGGALVGLPTGVSANINYVNIVSNSASPANSWYAGPNSVNSGSSGWIFSAAPALAGFFMLL